MTIEDFNAAKSLQDDITKINSIQAAMAISGAKIVANITQSDGKTVLVSHDKLSDVLGSAYTTIAATAFTSLGTQLTALESDYQADFDALGEA